MNTFKSFGLVILGAIGLIIYSTVFIVDERERALVVRVGEIHRSIEEPGFYFKIPFVDELVWMEDRMFFIETNDKSVQVADGRRYLVDAITMLRIVDSQKFRESVSANLLQLRDRIETRIESALRQTYGRRTFDAALSQDRPAMMREIAEQVRPEALSLGVQVVDVRVRRTDLMPKVFEQTYERMSAERFAEAAEIRAVGEAQAARIRAEADRQKVELVATAQREAEIVRGEGEAERNKVFAQAFEKDAEFFTFYRTMKAYEKSLTGSDTTLVLTPDSEFFKFFGSSDSVPKTE